MAQPAPEQIAYYQAHADDDRRPNEIASLVCGLFAAIAALAARIAARRVSRMKLGLEDWTIFAAMSIHNGQGRHIIFIKDIVYFMKAFVVAVVSYSITVMLTKISILIFYCRIFQARWLTVCSIVIGAIVIMYNLAVILIAGLQCIPLSDLWNGGSSCINPQPPWFGFSIVNVVTDVAILALPVKPVLSLHLKLSRKLQVLGMFLTGGVVCVFGVLRAIAMSSLSMVDASWAAVGASIWSFTEISVGIVAACLPLLGPLFRNRDSPGAAKASASCGHVCPGNINAARLGHPGYIHQANSTLVDDVSMPDEQWPVLAPATAKAASTRSTNQIMVQSNIQHTVTFL
ncbi:hypothetical protein ASPCAL14622 [Aspergillus calidoustus]|uniref:Rhodopsin domain-containing protein n=1 Tax=Aspergillus calidoustus TaxID=454130 RepID=A0A0U5GIF6_ASPCI|nr:hypothetical protein ASPCAL14622 [Aspergillus calidoustus]